MQLKIWIAEEKAASTFADAVVRTEKHQEVFGAIANEKELDSENVSLNCYHTARGIINFVTVPPSYSPVFQYKYSYFSVFCMYFQYFSVFYKGLHIQCMY